MLTIKDLLEYRRAMGGLDQVLAPAASHANSEDNAGEGVSDSRLDDQTRADAVYVLSFTSPSASGTTIYCAVNGSGTALCHTGAWTSSLIQGVSFKISALAAHGDETLIRVSNDYHRCRTWAEAEVDRFLARDEADWEPWVGMRTIRLLLDAVANGWSSGAFTMKRGGDSLSMSERLKLLHDRIEAMDRVWSRRLAAGPVGFSAAVEYELLHPRAGDEAGNPE